MLGQIALVLLLGLLAFHPIDLAVGRLVPHDMLSTLLSVTVTATVLAATLYALFVRRMRKLNAALEAVAEGDLDRELPRLGGEIGKINDNVGRMIATLRTNYDDLKKNDDLRRSLIANVSHELRTPLTSIQGYVETTKLAGADCPDFEKNLEICLRETKKLGRLVQDLFELSKLDTQHLEFHFEVVSLVELADQIGMAFEQRMEEKQINFATRFGDDPLEVLGDGNRLGQVITNLLGNASVFTRPDGTVTLSCERVGGKARCEVIDTGVGIPAKDLPHIFESFFHLEKSGSRNLGGTGLGLAICKAIVEAHGGTICVRSDVGQGTVFTFELDLAPQDDLSKV